MKTKKSSSSPFISHLQQHASSTSSGSGCCCGGGFSFSTTHKRPFSLNPSQPAAKKPKIIPPLPLLQEINPFLGCRVSHPSSNQPISPHPQQQNAGIECPGTPPLAPKRGFSNSMRSSAEKFSTTQCLKKITDCIKEVLGYIEDCANAQMSKKAQRSHYDDNNIVNSKIYASAFLENSDDGYDEIIVVEKKGETLTLNLKCPCGADYQTVLVVKKKETLNVNWECPCGAGYQIVLFEGICYYKIA
ncbi:hypothetical protein OWV82_022751 [Melia azedarach]|uniref:Uncharacterized protein n=1 Tax=Melia azedarach TaxID=155640 RepID=A0ACC1WUV9_MELAZ|nr:hypothetical protein OWV82_022751 [Melia azedarach]